MADRFHERLEEKINNLEEELGKERNKVALQKEILDEFPGLIVVADTTGSIVEYYGRVDYLEKFSENIMSTNISNHIPLKTEYGSFSVPEDITIKQPLIYEYSIESDGEAKDFAVKMKKGNLDEIFYIITETTSSKNKRTEDYLQEAPYKSLIEFTTGDMFLLEVKNQDEFRFVKTGDSYENFVGIEKENISGKKPEDIFDEKTVEHVSKKYKLCAESKKETTYEEKNFRDGSLKYREITLYPISINEEVKYILGTGKDITQQKLLEEEKEKLIKKLQNTSETKDKFFSIVAHDLKSPLIGITGFLKILNEEYHSITEKERLKYTGLVFETAKKTFNLLEDILEWAVSSKNEEKYCPQKLNITDVVNQVYTVNKSSIERAGVEFYNFVEEEKYLYADYNMFSLILRNLVTNSTKFTGEGGSIFIDYSEYDKYHLISIKDTGVGMEKSKLNSLFDLSKKNISSGVRGEKGTGLGLDLVKRYMQRHGGEVEVESEPGKGTVFNLYFPKNIIKYKRRDEDG